MIPSCCWITLRDKPLLPRKWSSSQMVQEGWTESYGSSNPIRRRRDLTAEESGHASLICRGLGWSRALLSNRAVDNRTYNPADYDSSYIAIRLHDGYLWWRSKQYWAPEEPWCSSIYLPNLGLLWLWKGFVSYASNKHRKTANEQVATGLSDNFIIKQNFLKANLKPNGSKLLRKLKA